MPLVAQKGRRAASALLFMEKEIHEFDVTN